MIETDYSGSIIWDTHASGWIELYSTIDVKLSKSLTVATDVTLTKGDITVTEGDIVMTKGDLIVTDGEINVFNTGVSRINIDSAGNNSGFKLLESNVARYSIASYDGGKFSLWDEFNSLSRLFIDPAGKVGIGNDTPSVDFALKDSDTGLNLATADALSLIAGGVEGHRITEAAGAITHELTGDVNIGGNTDVAGNLEASTIFTRPSTQNIGWGTTVVNLTTSLAIINTSGPGTLNVSLADGTAGQEKFFVETDAGNDCILTPVHLLNGSTITFNSLGEYAHLIFVGTSWVCLSVTATLA